MSFWKSWNIHLTHFRFCGSNAYQCHLVQFLLLAPGWRHSFFNRSYYQHVMGIYSRSFNAPRNRSGFWPVSALTARGKFTQPHWPHWLKFEATGITNLSAGRIGNSSRVGRWLESQLRIWQWQLPTMPVDKLRFETRSPPITPILRHWSASLTSYSSTCSNDLLQSWEQWLLHSM